MILRTQIELIIFSFIFGIIFSLFLSVNYKLIYNKNKIIKILSSFSIILLSSIIYFIEINKINNAIIHYYSLIFIAIGFTLSSFVEKKLKK